MKLPLILGRLTVDCKSLVALKVDLSSVPKSDFELVSSGKGDYYKIHYSLEMSFEAAISFRLLVKGTCDRERKSRNSLMFSMYTNTLYLSQIRLWASSQLIMDVDESR